MYPYGRPLKPFWASNPPSGSLEKVKYMTFALIWLTCLCIATYFFFGRWK